MTVPYVHAGSLRDCANCRRRRFIAARGLCGSCYAHLRKYDPAGLALFPTTRKRAAS